MSHTAVRTVAALLSATVTVGVLKGVALLAAADDRARPVVVMPPVVVTAPALDAATVVGRAASDEKAN